MAGDRLRRVFALTNLLKNPFPFSFSNSLAAVSKAFASRPLRWRYFCPCLRQGQNKCGDAASDSCGLRGEAQDPSRRKSAGVALGLEKSACPFLNSFRLPTVKLALSRPRLNLSSMCSWESPIALTPSKTPVTPRLPRRESKGSTNRRQFSGTSKQKHRTAERQRSARPLRATLAHLHWIFLRSHVRRQQTAIYHFCLLPRRSLGGLIRPVRLITAQHFLHVTASGLSVAIPSTSARCAASRSRGLQATIPLSSRKCMSRLPGRF